MAPTTENVNRASFHKQFVLAPAGLNWPKGLFIFIVSVSLSDIYIYASVEENHIFGFDEIRVPVNISITFFI